MRSKQQICKKKDILRYRQQDRGRKWRFLWGGSGSMLSWWCSTSKFKAWVYLETRDDFQASNHLTW